MSGKDKEIAALKEELQIQKTKTFNLEDELKSVKQDNAVMIERTRTMEKTGNEKIKSLQSMLKQVKSQHNIDKETLQKEMELLKAKDETFINQIYKERDEYKTDLTKMKKQFKERELSLVFIFILSLHILYILWIINSIKD